MDEILKHDKNDQIKSQNPQNKKFSFKKILIRMVYLILAIIIGFSLSMGSYLFIKQKKMIYYPQRYNSENEIPKEIVKIKYKISNGNQTVFYLPPKDNPDVPPKSLWILFNGNGSLAIDWLEYLGDFRMENIGFLLIEYPGYGFCEGSPSKKSITESSSKAFSALAEHFKVSTNKLDVDINIIGFSLGTATSLQFAVEHNIRKIILVAPFTSMLDMTKISVGPIFSHLLTERYDSRQRLKEIIALKNPPEIYIFHGDSDTVVPFRMGKELAELNKNLIKFFEIKGSDHVNIFDFIKNKILDIIKSDKIE